MNKISFLLFSTFFSNFSHQIIAQDQYDNFPLSKNLQYSYYFHEEWLVKEFFATTQHKIDSGNVDLIIRDSSLMDGTTKIWNIEQRVNLQHTELLGDHDTIYTILDTSYFSLYESLTGNHELRCKSIVWTFPLKFSNSSICRYSDSVNVLYTFSDDLLGDEFWKDSIWFANEFGMYQRILSQYTIHNSISHYDLIYRLMNKPITTTKMEEPYRYEFNLSQNYPNPFNPSTTIQYSLVSRQFVTLKVFDVIGKEIAVLVNEEKEPGFFSIEFSAKGVSASGGNAYELPSGIYFYRLEAGNFRETRKMVLLR